MQLIESRVGRVLVSGVMLLIIGWSGYLILKAGRGNENTNPVVRTIAQELSYRAVAVALENHGKPVTAVLLVPRFLWSRDPLTTELVKCLKTILREKGVRDVREIQLTMADDGETTREPVTPDALETALHGVSENSLVFNLAGLPSPTVLQSRPLQWSGLPMVVVANMRSPELELQPSGLLLAAWVPRVDVPDGATDCDALYELIQPSVTTAAKEIKQ
jgi:hypothetical protein